MTKHDIMIVADYSQSEPLSLEELMELCQSSPNFIQALIDFGILEAHSLPVEERAFDVNELRRIKAVQRLQRDLEINMAGAAMVLDLIDQLEEMRAKIEFFEKHFPR
jgi:chaperone modulatory protein CbpM